MYAYPSPLPPAERVRLAWQQRPATDYRCGFWSALGWTILTLGIYGFYVFYQLVRRMRDHNRRRLELLDAANAFAWDRAIASGLADELRPLFERVGTNLNVLRTITTEFRDPVIWTLLDVVASVASIVAFVLLDGDLVRHDLAEGAVESDLATIYARLGTPLPLPDPTRLKGQHSYVARIVVLLVTFGLYGLWWWHDMMVEANRHFDHNWAWEDELARVIGATPSSP